MTIVVPSSSHRRPIPLLALALRILCHWMVSVSLASSVYAGSYQLSAPAYSCSGSAAGGASINPNQTTPNAIYGGGPPNSSLSLSGTATITATWQPDAPGDIPPKSVIIQESVNPSGGNYQSIQSVTVTRTTGLANNLTTRYRVINNPGNTFSINSPSVSVTVTNNGFGGMTCRFDYSATVSNVTVNLFGSTNDGGTIKALAGQLLTAQLTTSLPQKTGSHSWTISGDIFKNWHNGVFTPFPSSDLTLGQPSFYGLKATTIVATSTAKVLVPANADPINGELTVTGESKPCAVQKATVVDWDIQDGRVVFSSDSFILGNYGSVERGQDWEAEVSLPAPFTGTGGQFCFCQLVTTTLYAYTIEDPPTNRYVPTYNGVAIPIGVEALDNSFPYASQYYSIGTKADDIGDSPSQLVPLVINAAPVSRVVRDDAFRTWLMYRPPSVAGQNTTWIPLEIYNWGWGCEATRNGPYVSIVRPLPLPAIPTRNAKGLMDVHPTWTQVISNSNGWVGQ